ncbi:hypothetical protein EUU23_03925 [Sphingorhabdus sp. IMCC26285]|uniref:Uncharacterized protein n=1 Tax=Sphingorhabdus profundilacus TaxID=2509718 RepID=A0A6I4LTU8_9SPHN|nr:hypothetical protein [Sphingorhabdus profundilacus]MVZ96852.1 hypothetical protein [Sphingorhabdus profundilacus]
MAKISDQNARSQAVILPASVFWFEIEAIMTSEGFDPFCPSLRQKALRYIHIPAASFLALNKIASNLDDNIYGFTA